MRIMDDGYNKYPVVTMPVMFDLLSAHSRKPRLVKTCASQVCCFGIYFEAQHFQCRGFNDRLF